VSTGGARNETLGVELQEWQSAWWAGRGTASAGCGCGGLILEQPFLTDVSTIKLGDSWPKFQHVWLKSGYIWMISPWWYRVCVSPWFVSWCLSRKNGWYALVYRCSLMFMPWYHHI
jgi:hypothetical protein